MNTQNFKEGFCKAAEAQGYSVKEAEALFASELVKHANHQQGDYFQNVKDVLRDQGSAPQYNVDDMHPSALNYNNDILKSRDEFGTKDPNLEGAKAGLGSGAAGALMGAGTGDIAGRVARKFVNPKFTKTLAHLPRVGRALGIAAGAIGAGLPAFEKARGRVESMHKLNDPRIMQAMLDQLSRERQLANNQLGSYRPIGIDPQGY